MYSDLKETVMLIGRNDPTMQHDFSNLQSRLLHRHLKNKKMVLECSEGVANSH